MQFSVAKGAMKMIALQGNIGFLANIGLSEDDFRKVTGKNAWLGTDKSRMTQCLNILLTGTLDVLGIPRFQLPAEYVAAGIAVFVDPINCHAACRFMEHIPSASALSKGADDSEECTARQLFALVVQLVGDPDRSYARVLFEKNTQLKLEEFKNTTQEQPKGDIHGKSATR